MNLIKTQKILFLFATTMMLFSGLIAQPKKSFQINVSVENLKLPGKLILTVRDVNQWTEYVAESSNGKFILTGSVREPSFAYLVMKYGNETDRGPRMENVSQLFVENMVIKIQTKDSLRGASIQAGTSQKDLEELNATLIKWNKEMFETSRLIRKQDVIGDFIDAHPSSPASIYAIQNFSMDGTFSINSDEVEPLYNKLSAEAKNSLSGNELNKDIQRARQTSIGAIAPEFVQKDTVGVDVSLSSFRGQYVLVDFWASWCKPCRAENPMLVQTFLEYKGKNFTVVSVSLDNNKASWIKAIHKDQLTWTHTSDLKFWKNEVALLYGVKTVPQNYLLDPTGKIIGKNIRSAELGKWLESNGVK
jgi:thiol-disulfide isomerase/thioredoxin